MARSTAKNVCRICYEHCPMVVEYEDGKPVAVRSDKSNDQWGGFFCSKGQTSLEQLSYPGRLLQTVRRTAAGTYEPIPHEEALDAVAAQIARILEESGPNSIACYMGTGTNWGVATFAPAFLQAIGSPMFFTSMTIDQPGKDIASALMGTWGAGLQPFEGSDVMLIVGSNPLVVLGGVLNGPNLPRRLTEHLARGLQLIVIDPRRTETARRARVHIQPRPGEDAAILAAMLRVILEEGLADQTFCDDNVQGLEALRAAVAPFTPDVVAARADVPAGQIVDAARLFAQGARGTAGGATGANMSGHSSLVEYLIQCLNAVCGRFVRAGEAISNPGVLLPPARPKAQPRGPRPARNLGLPMAVRGLGLAASGLPTAALAEQILEEGDGRIRVLFSCGGNPASAWPDQGLTLRALRKLDLFVQLDVRMSSSAKLAHYVFPPRVGLENVACSWFKEGLEAYSPTYAISQPFGYYVPAAASPPAGSDLVAEWEVFYGLARRLNLPLRIRRKASPNAVERAPRRSVDIDMNRKPTDEELLELLCSESRIPLAELKRRGPGVHLFDGEALAEAKEDACTERLQLGDPDMMAELEQVTAESVVIDVDFPFHLISRRNGKIINSAGRDLPSFLASGRTYNPAFMHPDDMRELDVEAGAMVEISSAHGVIVGVAEPDDTLRRGVISMHHSYGDLPGEGGDVRVVGSCTSLLTSVADRFDRFSGMPLMSGVPVRVRPWGAATAHVYVGANLRPQTQTADPAPAAERLATPVQAGPGAAIT